MRSRTYAMHSHPELTNGELYKELKECMIRLGFTEELERLNRKLFGTN